MKIFVAVSENLNDIFNHQYHQNEEIIRAYIIHSVYQ